MSSLALVYYIKTLRQIVPVSDCYGPGAKPCTGPARAPSDGILSVTTGIESSRVSPVKQAFDGTDPLTSTVDAGKSMTITYVHIHTQTLT